MKPRLLAASAAALMLFPAVASASYLHMAQARSAVARYAQHDGGTVGGCERNTAHVVACNVTFVVPGGTDTWATYAELRHGRVVVHYAGH